MPADANHPSSIALPMALQLKPCGPVIDAKAAERAREIVAETVWTPELEAAWPALAPVFGAADKIDVLLVGLGKEIAGFPKAIREALRERKIMVEAIATGGAVRTYNILLGEDRAVGAALIAVDSIK